VSIDMITTCSCNTRLGVDQGDRLVDIACRSGLALELAGLRRAGCAGIDASARLLAAAASLMILRRWWPVLLLVIALVGELALFLATAMIVGRPRPPVPHVDAALPPTSSFPSGHTGAAICLFGGWRSSCW
jgi:membrane-associated phospholipid phosphatase